MLNVLVICGSLRQGSFNKRIAQALPSLGLEELKFAMAPPISDIPLYNPDLHESTGVPNSVSALAAAIRVSEGLVIVSPEYNWSVPGALKNAIDWLSRLPDQPFKNKPVAIQSSSSGVLGGSRMQYHLRQILASVEAFVFVKPEVIVTYAQTRFDERGSLTDEPTRSIIVKQLTEFARYVSRHA